MQAHVARGMHAVWGGNVAGEMLEWYRRAAAPRPDTSGSATDRTMAAADGRGRSCAARRRGVMFLPHMSAAACPVVDPQSLGAFAGLGSARQRAAICCGPSSKGWTTSSCDMVSAMESALDSAARAIRRRGGRDTQRLLDAEQGRRGRSPGRGSRASTRPRRWERRSWPASAWGCIATKRTR